jgi:MIP family channel proteins
MSLGKRMAAECIGTFGFLLIAFLGVVNFATQGPLAIQSLGVWAGFGFGLALMIFAFGQVSGGHFNPAVTLGLAAAGKHPVKEILPYWLAQIVGGLLAALLLLALYSQEVVAKTVNAPGQGVGSWTAFVLEAILAALFVLVIATVATDDRAPWKGVFAPFAIGLFIFTACVVSGAITGASLNPGRSLASAIVAGDFANIWIYLLAPTVGGVIGGVVHLFFSEPDGLDEFEDMRTEAA